MQSSGDVYVMGAIVALAAVWLLLRVRKWLLFPRPPKLPVDSQYEPIESEAKELLEQSGYRVIAGKVRIPIHIDVDGKKLESRFYIDYFAASEEDVYVVKCSKERKPMDWTGSGLRDRLLPYHLLYGDNQITGVLYVDLHEKNVKKIIFELDLP